MGAWGIGSSAVYFIPQKPVGTISGEEITRDQLADFETRWRRILLTGLQGPLLDLVWKQLIYEREASRSGIIVTDNDISEGIQDLSFQIFGGKPNISSEQLIIILCNNFNVNRDQLLQTIKEVMRIHKLDFFLKNSVRVTTEEAWQRYSLENEKVKIKYASFNTADFVDTVSVTDAEIEAFYNKNKDVLPDKLTGSYGYKEPEKVKIEYIMANYNELEKRVNITDDEMLKYYEENKEVEFRENIRDKSTTDNEKNNNDNPDSSNESKDAQDGDSNPELKQFRPYNDIKELIKSRLQKQKAKDMANELIAHVDEEVYENLDKLGKLSFKDLAQKYDLTYEIPKSPDKKNELISKDEAEMLLIGTDRFASNAFNREKYDPSPPLDALDGRYIFQVIDRQSPSTPPLSEIYEKVKSDLKLEMAFRKTRELAELCLNKMKDTSFKEGLDSFISDMGGKGPEYGETEYLSRPTLLDNRSQAYIVAMQEYRPSVVSKAFKLKDKEIALAVEDEGKKASYLITLVDKKEITREEFDKNTEQIFRRYVGEKQRHTISKWEENLLRQSHLDI